MKTEACTNCTTGRRGREGFGPRRSVKLQGPRCHYGVISVRRAGPLPENLGRSVDGTRREPQRPSEPLDGAGGPQLFLGFPVAVGRRERLSRGRSQEAPRLQQRRRAAGTCRFPCSQLRSRRGAGGGGGGGGGRRAAAKMPREEERGSSAGPAALAAFLLLLTICSRGE